MDLGLDAARVVVTGAGGLLGHAIARGFVAEGARVLVVDVDGEQVERVRAGLAEGRAHTSAADRARAALADLEAGRVRAADQARTRPADVDARARAADPVGRVRTGRRTAADVDALACDLAVDGAGAAVIGRAVERWGGVDVLVNTAGWSEPGWFAEQVDRALWQRTIEANLFSAIDCTQAAIGLMRAAGRGAIVFLSSDAAFGAIRQGIYGSTKAGLISLARTVAREHGRHGIRANVVAPGLVLPPDGEEVGPSSVWAGGAAALFTDAQVDSVVRTQALRRQTLPEDVANAVLWLSSDVAARQVTGQVVAVGGGSSMP